MNGQTGRSAAGTLIARSRRPARATVATAVLRLTGGMDLASAPDAWVPAAMPVPGPGEGGPVATPPVESGRPGLSPRHAVGAAPADAALPGVPAPTEAPAPARRGGRPRLPSPAAASGPRPGMWTGAAIPVETPATGPPGALPVGYPPAATGPPPGDRDAGHAAHVAPVTVPAILDRLSGSGPRAPFQITTASPLVDRARRPAPSVTAADPPEQPAAASPATGPFTVSPGAPERAPAVPAPPDSPRAVPAHPPVTIGEIHVHVTEPAPPSADPLALLAHYAQGLTARRDGPL